MRKYSKDKGASEPFVGLSWSMMDSAAWKSLSLSAVWIYIHMKRRWHGGRLTLPFTEARWKMKWPAFDRARKELIDLGFIAVLEKHGLDGLATVYGTSEKWKERSRELMKGHEAGRIVRRIRRVNGEATIVRVWEPVKPQSDRRAAAQRANLKRADAANPKKGVTASDRITSPQRTSPKKNPLQSPDKHVIGFPNLGNDNQRSTIPNLGNGKRDSHSQFGKRAIPNLGNDNAISTGRDTAPPKRRGRKPKEIRKSLSLAELSQYANRLHAGEPPQALKAEIDAKGCEVPAIILRAPC